MLGLEFNIDDPRRAVLSHAVRQMQRQHEWPTITNSVYTNILLNSTLPKVAEQADNLILWLGSKVGSSDAEVEILSEELQAIIGAQRVESVQYIANHLQSKKLITFGRTDDTKATPPLIFQMTFDGWQEFEKLNKTSSQSSIAFMAMKYGDSALNEIVNSVFRPAVQATGFTLTVLTDDPRAGLIDDHLRVEIRRSKFLIADITHKNLGAYWEAGFAEGLGKPVIYTCQRDEFSAGASHFDTNHHLTVLWHSDHAQVANDLKSTIRATLPFDAKQDD